jgi:transcriptional regulator with XRE-family HTH domain
MAKPKPNNADVLVGLGERIRTLRKKRGWTQVIMSEKIGMDRSFIADLERGKRNITILNLVVLAQGFDTTLSQLLSRL